jgi:hypothetical protein
MAYTGESRLSEIDHAGFSAVVQPNQSAEIVVPRYGQIFYQRESPRTGYPINVKGKERGGFNEYVKINDQYLTYQPGTVVHLAFDLKAVQLKVFQDGTLIQRAFGLAGAFLQMGPSRQRFPISLLLPGKRIFLGVAVNTQAWK